jgi:sulfur-oxidizing protein SoxA
MKKIIITMATTALLSSPVALAQQSPAVQADIDAFQSYFIYNFANSGINSFSKGPYAMSDDKMMQFEAIMEMPPFEDLLEKGEELWHKPFANGKIFSSCFKEFDTEIRAAYPRWNHNKGKVDTLEQALIDCLVTNGEKKWGTGKGKHAWVAAYLTNIGVGTVINVIVPADDPAALAAYNDGKRFYYAKRGQLNMSCANCHIDNAGKRARGNTLSTGLGQTTHFPVWRGKWAKSKGDGFGTIQRRYGGCNKQVRAKPFKRHKSQYDNLEFFHTAMSNGMEISGTEYRE